MAPKSAAPRPSAAVLAAVAILRARSAARRTLGLPFPAKKPEVPVDGGRKADGG